MADEVPQTTDDDNPLAFKEGKMTFPLPKPIKAHGKEMTELTIKEPTGKDVIAVGTPVDFDPTQDPPRLYMNTQKMAAMISRLAEVPPSSVEQLSPKTISQIGWILAPFFSPV